MKYQLRNGSTDIPDGEFTAYERVVCNSNKFCTTQWIVDIDGYEPNYFVGGPSYESNGVCSLISGAWRVRCKNGVCRKIRNTEVY